MTKIKFLLPIQLFQLLHAALCCGNSTDHKTHMVKPSRVHHFLSIYKNVNYKIVICMIFLQTQLFQFLHAALCCGNSTDHKTYMI